MSTELKIYFRWTVLIALVLWIIFIFTCRATFAATPSFLTCDCSPAVDLVTGFQLKFNTNAFIDVPAVMTCGTLADKVVCTGDQRTICYDITPLPIGAITVIGRAVGSGGTSNDSLPFSFTKAGLPSSPSLLRKVQ
jgi:hypothetical protein